VFLAPLLHLDHVVGPWRRIDLERVGRQLDLHAMSAKLSHRARVALFAGDSELEGIHAGQALSAVGIAQECDALERDGIVEQLQIQLGTMLFDPLQGFLAQPVVVP
jgi:hypothetical protein